MKNNIDCLRCGKKMNHIRTEKIQLGQTGWILGDLPNLLAGAMEVEIYSCPKCRKLEFFLADTVGFIHKLPHGLIKAFRSTLDEVREADLLLHVVDFSDEKYKQHMKVTEETLQELDAGGIPVIYVYNKADLCGDKRGSEEISGGGLPVVSGNKIYMSAKNGIGVTELVELITDTLYAGNSTVNFMIPYDKGQIVSDLNEKGNVILQEYVESGVRLVVNCKEREKEKYKEYIVEGF